MQVRTLLERVISRGLGLLHGLDQLEGFARPGVVGVGAESLLLSGSGVRFGVWGSLSLQRETSTGGRQYAPPGQPAQASSSLLSLQVLEVPVWGLGSIRWTTNHAWNNYLTET